MAGMGMPLGSTREVVSRQKWEGGGKGKRRRIEERMGKRGGKCDGKKLKLRESVI